MKLFQILKDEALAALTREQLSEYVAALKETAEKIHAKDAETIGELSASERLEEMRAGVAAIKLASERLAELTEAEEAPEAEATDDDEAAKELEALAAEARGEAVEPEAEVVEPEAEVTEPVAAATLEETVAKLAEQVEALSAPAEPVEPEAVEEPEAEEATVASLPKPTPARQAALKKQRSLTAASEGLGGIALGEEFEDLNAIAAAMIHKRRNFGHMTAREDVPIARLDWRDDYPADRVLDANEGGERTQAKIDAVVASIKSDPNKGTEKSLVAAGGICAPLTPLYDLQVISQADRPVRASLPSFLASRGGITYATPPVMADVTEAIGIITAAEDAAGGSLATKTCQVLECMDWNEATIDIIYHCVQTSNLTNRTFPEQLAQFLQLLRAQLARTAESKLLDGIDDASTAVTAADINLGASGALLTEILTAANAMRNRHRMSSDAVLRVMLPNWSVDLMISDIIRTQFQRFDTDRARLTALLRSFNVDPTFYIDGATGAGQIFGAQTASDLLTFPDTVRWYLFPEGSFLYLDGGTLELGLVRDSVLNSTNEFQMFGEEFENVAFVGIESLAVTSTVCDNGKVASTDDLVCGDYS